MVTVAEVDESQATKARKSPQVVYLIESALAPRDLARWGIGLMVERGYQVSILECARLSFPDLAQDRSCYPDFTGFDLVEVTDAATLRRHQNLLNGADLIVCLCGVSGFNRHNLPIFRSIATSGRPWLTISTNVYPGFNRYREERTHLRQRLVDIVKRLPNINLIDSLIARLPRRWLGIPFADFTLYSGEKSQMLNVHAGAQTRRLFVHSMDYDRFLGVQAKNHSPKDIAVFLDEYLPYHRDIVGVNAEPPEDPEHYYHCMRQFFDRIETELGLKVVVAASPRSNYEDHPGVFGDRLIVKGETDRLIAESRLVVGHRSTSIAMAVMFRKPILIVATCRQSQHWWHEVALRSYAESLGRPLMLLDTDQTIAFDDAFIVDDAAYDRFLRDFVKIPGTAEKPFWHSALDAIIAVGGLPS